MENERLDPLLDLILGAENPGGPSENGQLYEAALPQKKLYFRAPYAPDEVLWDILFPGVRVMPLAKTTLAVPLLNRGKVWIGKEDWAWMMAKLTGFKKVPTGKIPAYVFTRLRTNYLKARDIFRILSREDQGEVVLGLLSESRISFQMLFTLFQLMEKETSLASLLSERAYLTLKEEVAHFSSAMEGNKTWEQLTEFLSGYLINDFLRENHKSPVFQDFLKSLQRMQIEGCWDQEKMVDWMLALFPGKEFLRCLSTIPDGVLPRALKPSLWERFAEVISRRAKERLIEDSRDLYLEETAYSFQLEATKKIIEYQITQKPPFYFLNKATHLASELNLIFDLCGPLPTAIFFQQSPHLKKALLDFLSPFRKALIQMYLNGKIRKQNPLTGKEAEQSIRRFHFYVAAAQLVPDFYYML